MSDMSSLRDDFPILQRVINGKPLVFLDSGASSQKPVQVLDTMDTFYRTSYANVHRGAYTLSQEATILYEGTRTKVAGFINASSDSEVVFTRSATAAMNLLAYGWGLNRLERGDRIVTTMMEHHANIVPWQMITKHTGAELVYVDFDDTYRIAPDAFAPVLDERVKIVSISGMSNVLGTMPAVPEIAEMAHAVGAIVVVDGAQLVPHGPVDVQTYGADFLAFSAHKMLGPTGVGVLWGRRALLDIMEPMEGGGDMISDVGLYESTWAPVPHKFEAGTPPFAEAIGLGAAIDYLTAVGMDNIFAHDQMLTSYALARLSEIPDLTVQGPSDVHNRGGAVSFTLGDIHAHDLATILDQEGVAVRAGHHCAKPLMRRLNVPATARASFYLYNTKSDVDALVEALGVARKLFGL
ncbi:MAG: cysteine desulfurase [Acidimicrobiia bacterium]|nr:cysteine desulfurase [Acidimicrobiia bacterium]